MKYGSSIKNIYIKKCRTLYRILCADKNEKEKTFLTILEEKFHLIS